MTLTEGKEPGPVGVISPLAGALRQVHVRRRVLVGGAVVEATQADPCVIVSLGVLM